mgnify:CR=1 FL=1
MFLIPQGSGEKVVTEVAGNYPEVTLEHMLVDNSAMQLVKNPAQFDVMVTEKYVRRYSF